MKIKFISDLRFPMAMLVVFIHADILSLCSHLDGNAYPVYSLVFRIISLNVADIAVPLFFVISGFLFFRDVFGIEVYADKIRKRIKSLLVPYLFWNGITLLFFFLAQRFIPQFFTGKGMNISEMTSIDYIYAFWNMSYVKETMAGTPIASQMWFVRDLMICSFISPLVYFFNKGKFLSPLLNVALCVLWMMRIVPLSLIFFSLGCFFSLGKIKLRSLKSAHLLSGFSILYIVGTFLELQFDNYYFGWGGVIHRINILIGIILVIGISLQLEGRVKIPEILSRSSFFLFCFHMLPLTLLKKVLISILLPTSSVELLLLYFLSVIVIISVGILLYQLVERNKMMLLLTCGGR